MKTKGQKKSRALGRCTGSKGETQLGMDCRDIVTSPRQECKEFDKDTKYAGIEL